MNRTLAFGKYRPVQRLAVGGMGEIYLARQDVGLVPGVERWVVLKTVLPQNDHDDDTLIMQFLDEAKIVASLNHPHIVSVHEIGVWAGEQTIVLEFIDGVDLSQLLTRLDKRGRTLTDSFIARIARDAALALHHAHTATGPTGAPLGIVHRDVSPQNLMLRRDGIIKVLDFGVAKVADAAQKTASGMIKGKRGYMSPEQVRAESLDHRSDQFSLGIVLWELCTGQRLFRGLSDLQVFQSILATEIPSFASLNAPGRPALEAIVRRTLCAAPGDRFASCQELAEAIEATGMRLASERELAVCLESEFPECANAKLFSPRLAEITSAEVNTGPTRVLSAPTTAAEHSTAGMRLWVAVTAVLALAVLTIAVSRSRSTVDGAIAAPSAAPVEPSAAGVPDTQYNPRPPPAPTVEPESLTPKPRSRRRPSPAKRVAGNGSLTLQTNPWTHVFIDGERVGMTPIFELELAAGPKTLRLVNKELGVDERTRVRIRPGRTERLKLNLVRNDEASAPESAP